MGKKLSGNGLVVTNVRAAKKKHDEVLNTGLEPMTEGSELVFCFISNFNVKLTLALTREQNFSVA